MEDHDNHHHPYAPMNIDDHIMMDGPDVSVVPSNSTPVSSTNVWDLVDSWVIDPLEDHQHTIIDDHHNNHQNQQEVGSVDVINGCDVGRSRSDQRTRDGHDIEDQCHDHNEEDDQLPLQVVWPSAPVPNSCSSCQVFREITHTNGTHTTKLEVHGEVGHVSHAVYKSNQGLDTSDFRIHHMLKQNLEDIKDYLKDYLEEYRTDGYILLQDRLSLFYEALCVGYDWINSVHHGEDFQTNNIGSFEQGETSNQAINPFIMDSEEMPPMFRTELSIQRERIKKMTLEDFAKYFDLPIDAASKQLCLCATVIKKKIRSFKIPRWPYRKVKSIQRKISLLNESLGANCTGADHQTEIELQMLQRQLDDILSGRLKP